MAPRGRVRVRQPTQEPRRERLEQDARDAVPEAHARPLGGVVEERGGEQVGGVVALAHQAARHVERMPPVGDGHSREDGPGAPGERPSGEGLLLRRHAGADVGDELPDPTHRRALG
ncbi:MAG: hypothetical protein ABI841_00140 [Chloroflexota bacterium]